MCGGSIPGFIPDARNPDEVVHGGECAILTAKKMLEEWQTTCEQIMPDGGGGDSHDANASYNTLSATGGSYDHLNGYRVSSAGAGGGVGGNHEEERKE